MSYCAGRRTAILALCLVTACGGGGGEVAGPPAAPPSGPPSTPAAIASIAVSPSSLNLEPGESRQLTAVVRNTNNVVVTDRAVTWSTSNAAVATVSPSTGIATGVGNGSATITASLDAVSGKTDITVLLLAPVQLASVAAGGAHTCALSAAGAPYCWGRDESGQAGGSTGGSCELDGQSFPCSISPIAVRNSPVLTQITAGGAHTCGLTADGSAHCWGSNQFGQLGDNSNNSRGNPAAVVTAQKFAIITAGAHHTCGLTASGAAWCWGLNGRGQLGDGTVANRLVPTLVTGGLSFRLISAGGFSIGHTCGLSTSGPAYCWGDNERGQLGAGPPDVAGHPNPGLVAGGHSFTTISAGLGRHTCAVNTAGAGYCWGENSFGGLGNGLIPDSPQPSPVAGGIVFAHIVAGGFIGHSCGLTGAGVAYCWGENERGAVGDGSTADRRSPVPVAGGLTFTSLSLGFRHSCGRASSGTLYCWGSGLTGQLGTNSQSSLSVPTKVRGQP